MGKPLAIINPSYREDTSSIILYRVTLNNSTSPVFKVLTRKVELLFSIIIFQMPMKVIQPPNAHGVQQDNLNITMKK